MVVSCGLLGYVRYGGIFGWRRIIECLGLERDLSDVWALTIFHVSISTFGNYSIGVIL